MLTHMQRKDDKIKESNGNQEQREKIDHCQILD